MILSVIFFFVCLQSSISFKSVLEIAVKRRVQTLLRDTNLNVATYNVLSSKLCDQDTYTQCKPEHLFAPTRFLLIKKKILAEINKRSVICLQEVSNEWASELHSLFSKQGYHFLTGLYGKRGDGYMGVAIAVPLDKYEVLDSDVKKIGESRQTRKANPASKGLWNKIGRAVEAARAIFRGTDDQEKEESSLWENVRKKENQMVCVRLQNKESPDESFVVGTYHMPCAFTQHELMVVHGALSAQHIERFSGGLPIVLTGDFNCRPHSALYSLLTSGSLDSKVSHLFYLMECSYVLYQHPEYPKLEPDDHWRPSLQRPLGSAYHSPSGDSTTIPNYIETFDYIFCSPEWKVNAVGPLPPRGVWRPAAPNAEEPSNHFLHSASLTLPGNWAQFPEEEW